MFENPCGGLQDNVYYAPNGSVTISNPVETYYQSLPPGCNPVEEALTVALESDQLWPLLTIAIRYNVSWTLVVKLLLCQQVDAMNLALLMAPPSD
jgi:hypothetical protein